VRNIGIQQADALIVQTIIGMAHSLDIDVIAEGVETEEQRAFLERHGCNLWQGYLLGRPVPMEEIEQRLMAPATSGAAAARGNNAPGSDEGTPHTAM
jgi:EAL domain-containing protein (putative c-di-GMP-specific phosphodiesterase class I)